MLKKPLRSIFIGGPGAHPLGKFFLVVCVLDHGRTTHGRCGGGYRRGQSLAAPRINLWVGKNLNIYIRFSLRYLFDKIMYKNIENSDPCNQKTKNCPIKLRVPGMSSVFLILCG